MLLIWAAALFARPDAKSILLPSGNAAVDSVVFLALAFAAGHIVQWCAKHTIEPIIKWWFWEGRFFSEVFLVPGSGRCSERSRAQYLRIADTALAAETALLNSPESSRENAEAELYQASQDVYRRFESFASDKHLATKAITQNAFYGMFRGLSLVCLVSVALFVLRFVQEHDRFSLGVCVVALLCGLAFLDRARERGELHVKGLFEAVAAHLASSTSASPESGKGTC